MTHPLYGSAQWKRTRLLVLTRDGWCCRADHDCEYKTPGSLKFGYRVAHVHHIVDRSEGGAFFDPDNLMAVCRGFNLAERNRRQNKRAAEAIAARHLQKTYPENW